MPSCPSCLPGCAHHHHHCRLNYTSTGRRNNCGQHSKSSMRLAEMGVFFFFFFA
ncbi:hypothetical protein BU23DRAFT_162606 [Bimuria novae-zelandiae CBS 107.79]|uniref:Uncharacterized protein n=1 Tax=Bimuria novae-zelandiae CBS 107.79 TaxID=1447943 RepID=A0A6A5V5P3_9PLEO|nr:hypothetical protein BU23DRAFT_162606 [Bimuria novae-zelandiae CBS 107.79]